MEGTGLGGVRTVKSPPAPTTIAHGVLLGWSAARNEHRGQTWKSARELALEPERWAVPMRRERGYAQELPDLAVWTARSKAPGAVIAESGGRREDRQKMILEGWRDAIWSGRYFVVRYDCTSPSVAHWINRLATKVGLTASNFKATVQTTAEQIAALPPPSPPTTNLPATTQHCQTNPRRHPRKKSRSHPCKPPEPETAEAAAERKRRYREALGIAEPKPRRRWRR